MITLKNKMRMLLLAGTVLVAPLSFGQEGKERMNKDPKARAEAQTQRMTTELGLSDEQAGKIRAINLEHMEKVQSLKATGDEAQRKAAMKEVHNSQKAAITAVLTPEQQAKAAALRAERSDKYKDPKARAQERSERLTKELGLSADQATAIQTIELEHMQKMQRVKAIEDEKRRKAAMDEVRTSKRSAIAAVLTPEQKERMKAIHAEKKGERDGKRDGPGPAGRESIKERKEGVH